MKKTIISIILVLSLLITFVACGENESTSPEDGTTTTTKKTTTTRENETVDPGDTEDDLTDYTDLFIPFGKAVIDGVRDDSWNSSVTVTLEQVKKGTPAEGVEVKASAMWDNDAIYFLFEITDPDIYQIGTAGDYNIDGIYLYISEDYEAYTSSFASFSGGVYQFALINKELELLPRHGDASQVTGAQSAYNVTDNSMTIEFCYTPSVVPLAAGNTILLDYQYNDASSTGVRNGGLGWYNGTDTNTQTILWAYASLLAEGESAPEK